MPIKVLVEGVETEVFTQEELDAQKSEALELYKKDNPDKAEDIKSLQAEINKRDEELKGLKDKDFNFANLRTEKKALEDKLDKMTKDVDDKIGTVKKEILEGVMKDHYNDAIASLSGGDAELQKKIEFQYKRLGDSAATKEEISKKLNDAFLLAAGTKEGGSQAVFSSGGVGRIKVENKNPLNDEQKELLKRMGAAGGMKFEDKDLQ